DEEYLWYELAHELRLPLSELKQYVSYSEFLDWQAYFYIRERKTTKQDWYMASIAHQVHVVNGGKRKLDAFLLKYREPSKKPENPAEHESMWLALVSAKPRLPEIQQGDEING
ncbi:MAG: hypothetical protein ACK5S6_02955, partial [bacterium]